MGGNEGKLREIGIREGAGAGMSAQDDDMGEREQGAEEDPYANLARLHTQMTADRKRHFGEGMEGYECIEALFGVLGKMVDVVENSFQQLNYRGAVDAGKLRFLALLDECGEKNNRQEGIRAVVFIEGIVKGLIRQYAQDLRDFRNNARVTVAVGRGEAAAAFVGRVCADVLVMLRAEQDDASGGGVYCRMILARLQTHAPITFERGA
jgi:hypothetical protein